MYNCSEILTLLLLIVRLHFNTFYLQEDWKWPLSHISPVPSSISLLTILAYLKWCHFSLNMALGHSHFENKPFYIVLISSHHFSFSSS